MEQEIEANEYLKEIRRMNLLLKEQLTGLRELSPSFSKGTGEHEQITTMIARLEQDQERYELIISSLVKKKVKSTIQAFRENQIQMEPVGLKVVK